MTRPDEKSASQQLPDDLRAPLLVMKGLLALAVTLLLVMIGVEAGLLAYERLVLKVPATPSAKGAIHIRSSHPGRVYELAPNTTMEREGVVVRTNSLGMRDDEPEQPLLSARRRILVLGDSVAWGFGVPTEKAFPQLLEYQLNQEAAAAGKPGVVVFNAAVDGYTLRQEVATLEALGERLKPELIVLAYVLNDPATEQDGGLSRYFRNELLLSRYLRISRERLQELSFGNTLPTEFYQRIHQVHKQAVYADLARLKVLAEGLKAPVILLVSPMLDFKPGEPYAWLNIHEDLKAYASKLGFHYVDVWPAFAGRNAADIRIDVLHPDSTGHALIAAPLAEAAKRLLDRP